MANFNSYLYNEYKIYDKAGTHTWTKPADIDDSKPILVHVWGAGGMGGNGSGSYGGGGGGLAVKLIDVSALGATETVTIGASATGTSDQSGATSFGNHCSATGGNSGQCNVQNPTGDTSNDLFGNGGIGVGGDINKRGGRGGSTYYSSSSNAGGGGGGSAPAPYGVSDGYRGGDGSTYAGGGGAGIGAKGGGGAYIGGAGGGSTGNADNDSQPQYSGSANSYFPCLPGGSGLGGAAGSGGATRYAYTTYGDGSPRQGEEGQGQLIVNPNQILVTGGGGAGGNGNTTSTYNINVPPSGGGPGAGGGGMGAANGGSYVGTGASGGFLGGGGGSPMYSGGGQGGIAGGGGAVGYSVNFGHGYGGCGCVIVQYARKI